MDLGLSGKVGLVTGGSRGIGRASATRLAEAGSDLMLVARTERDLREAQQAIAAATGRRVEICADRPALAPGLPGRGRRARARLRPARRPGQQRRRHPERRFFPARRRRLGGRFRAQVLFLRPPVAGTLAAAQGEPGGGRQHHRRRLEDADPQLHDRWCCQRRDHQLHQGAREPRPARRRPGQRGPSGHDRDRPARPAARPARGKAEGISRGQSTRKRSWRGAGLRRYGQPSDVANLVAFLASPLAGQIQGADLFIDGGATKSIL